jgi:hypothetical protein
MIAHSGTTEEVDQHVSAYVPRFFPYWPSTPRSSASYWPTLHAEVAVSEVPWVMSLKGTSNAAVAEVQSYRRQGLNTWLMAAT